MGAGITRWWRSGRSASEAYLAEVGTWCRTQQALVARAIGNLPRPMRAAQRTVLESWIAKLGEIQHLAHRDLKPEMTPREVRCLMSGWYQLVPPRDPVPHA